VDASNITTGTLPAARIGATSIDLTTKVTGDLPLANLAQGTARSVLGVTGNATADYAPIQGTADQVLRVNAAGTALEMGTVAAGGIAALAVTDAKINDVAASKLTGALPAANLPALIGFRATRSADQTIPTAGTWAKVNFDVETFDTNSAFDSTTNYRFTAPKTGYYQINACVTWSPATQGEVFGIRLMKNGTTVVSSYFPSQPYRADSNGFGGTYSDIVYLAATDTIHIEVEATYNNSVVYYQQGATFFAGAFLGV
jgi:hypothetical protein